MFGGEVKPTWRREGMLRASAESTLRELTHSPISAPPDPTSDLHAQDQDAANPSPNLETQIEDSGAPVRTNFCGPGQIRRPRLRDNSATWMAWRALWTHQASSGAGMRIVFGNCELVKETRELLRDGKSIHLSPKGFQFLELLVECRPRAIPKAEIHERLWPGTFITDGTLTSLLAEVRRAIKDDAREPKFVRTLHRFGYAFFGEVVLERFRSPSLDGSPVRPGRVYRLYCGIREIALDEGETVLGRDPNATIFLDHRSVSRNHARIIISGGKATVEDLGSKNGTWVGANRIHSETSLIDGDFICAGSVRLDFRIFSPSDSTKTARPRH